MFKFLGISVFAALVKESFQQELTLADLSSNGFSACGQEVVDCLNANTAFVLEEIAIIDGNETLVCPSTLSLAQLQIGCFAAGSCISQQNCAANFEAVLNLNPEIEAFNQANDCLSVLAAEEDNEAGLRVSTNPEFICNLLFKTGRVDNAEIAALGLSCSAEVLECLNAVDKSLQASDVASIDSEDICASLDQLFLKQLLCLVDHDPLLSSDEFFFGENQCLAETQCELSNSIYDLGSSMKLTETSLGCDAVPVESVCNRVFNISDGNGGSAPADYFSLALAVAIVAFPFLA